MKEYCKIHSVWKRAHEKPCQILVGEFARPEFAYLERVPWMATEKVDGTNVRIGWDGVEIKVAARTDHSQMPVSLMHWLLARFADTGKFDQQFPHKLGEQVDVCLYGEGYGGGIGSGKTDYGPAWQFVLFDVSVGPWWLARPAVEDVARGMGCDVVPVVGEGYLRDLCRHVEIGVKSSYGDFLMEGFVMRPTITLLDRKGDRILAKIKTSDYRTLEKHNVTRTIEIAKEIAAKDAKEIAARVHDDCPKCGLFGMARTQHLCVTGTLDEVLDELIGGPADVIEIKPDRDS